MPPVPRPAKALPPAIAEALAAGHTVLAPNQRAAHTLRRAFHADQQLTGASTWPSPSILPLDAFLNALYHLLTLHGHADALLLNHLQEHLLWRTIIAADPTVSALRSLDSLADLAASSSHLLHLYNGRPRLRQFAQSTDARAFHRWCQQFDRECNSSGYLPHSKLPALLLVSAHQLPPTPLLLVDFAPLPPAHAALVARFPHTFYQTQTPSAPTLHPASEPRSELLASAQWARQTLEHNPHATIAIVVPDLAAQRTAIARTFSHVLSPELETVANPTLTTGPFEFSLGLPLAGLPLIATALDLLRFTLAPLPIPTLSALLLSPSLVAPEEILHAAEFDAFTLREHRTLRPELSLSSLIRLLGSSPRLPRLLRSLRALQPLPAGPQSHAAIADTFRKLLAATAWPLTDATDSDAFQAHRRFESALDELATLDFNGALATPHEALAALTGICEQTTFAPESRAAPIQILGPLELGGLPFDALWFLSAGDLTWPATPAPSPLLPPALQRALGLPGAIPAHDHAAALALTARIAASATEVVFSYPVHLDEGLQRPSPALPTLPLYTSPTLPLAPDPLPYVFIPDIAPVPPLPDAIIKGGAAILMNQAACAFRAFAVHRLASTEPGTASLALDARDRGSIVHRVMELFWNGLRDLGATGATLRTLPPANRHDRLDDAITEALAPHRKPDANPWDLAYLATQHQRLHLLLGPWLTYESARPPFTVSASERYLADAHLGPLRLELRVDRIDETPAGPVILDYKTGVAAPSEWLSDRPDAPQLPLYAVLSELPLAGVAFALLRPGEGFSFKGYADSPGVFGKATTPPLPLADQVEDWRFILTHLAEAFSAGDVAVAPKCYPTTCRYCTQRILCRLDPDSLLTLSDEPDEAAPGVPYLV